MISDSALKPFGVTGEIINIKGQQLVTLMLGRKFAHMFLVGPLPTEAAGITGMDCLERTGDEISFKKGKLTLSTTAEEPHECDYIREARRVYRVSRGKNRMQPSA